MKFKILYVLSVLWQIMPLYAQQMNYSEEEMTIWKEHKQEMSEPVLFLAADVLSAIQSDYVVDPYDVRKLKDLCIRMETHKYLHNYILETASQRLHIKREIETHYWDSIASILIPSNPAIAGTYMGHIIKEANELKITGDTLCALKDLSLVFFRRLREAPCAYIVKAEIDTLKTILTRHQLEEIINSANAEKVELRCRNLWETLENTGLTVELEKNSDLRQAALFYQKEMFIRDYYVGDRDLIDANLNDLYRHKPRCIRMYEGIRYKNTVKKRQEERVGEEFSW